MSNTHHHHCDHHHAHGQHVQKWIVAVVILLNVVFVAVELTYGFIANSTALLADAGHNASDVLSLMMTGMAILLAAKQPSHRYTYGLRSTTILAALANGMLLLVACGAITLEAIQRFSNPVAIPGLTVSTVAGAGVVINGVSALLLMKGNKDDINIRGAFLHMAADTAISLAVLLAGVAFLYTDWYWLDPLISLVIVLVILWGTWSLLREAFGLALHAVPQRIDAIAISDYLRRLEGVREIHDLHIWGLSTTESALTVHLIMPDGHPGDEFINKITNTLRHDYLIHHSTVQIELGTSVQGCPMHSKHWKD